MHQQFLNFVDQLPFVISSPFRASHINLIYYIVSNLYRFVPVLKFFTSDLWGGGGVASKFLKISDSLRGEGVPNKFVGIWGWSGKYCEKINLSFISPLSVFNDPSLSKVSWRRQRW